MTLKSIVYIIIFANLVESGILQFVLLAAKLLQFTKLQLSLGSVFLYKIFKYLSVKNLLMILGSLVFIFFQVMLDLRLPDYMKEITVLIIKSNSKMNDILVQGGFMMLCAFGSIITAFFVAFFSAKVAASFSATLRGRMFKKVETFSLEEMGKFSTSSLITRTTNDVTQIQMFMGMGMLVIFRAPILAVMAVIKILDKNWQWSVVTGGAVMAMIVLVTILVIFVLPKFKLIQKLTDNLNKVTRENLTGLRVVRAYNAEDYQQAKFERANKELTDNYLYTTRIMALMFPFISAVMNGMSLAIYWVGAYIIDAADLSERVLLYSDMSVFMSYAVQVVISFMLLSFVFFILPRASVSAKRINEVLETKLSIVDGNSVAEDGVKGEIEFNNVSFKYDNDGDYVLSNISFTAKKGETIAFIGATGSGKTTLVNLIPRLFDVNEGEVLVNGVNVQNYLISDLRNKIGYVPQKAVMFSGTVSSNVAYGDNGEQDADENDIKKAVKIAQASDFVENMEHSYESAVAQGGKNLSGGQKQRLSIARAVSKKPEIFIFDDSFSALDYKTDGELRAALKKETADVTTLIVAQRIGTIRNADKIVVLDEGKIIGMGTHNQLLSECEVYKEIAYSQLSKEELE